MKRVLIVDDAFDLARLLQDALRGVYPGAIITVVPSGEEALLEATRFPFDLVVTDYRLPGMSGGDLIRKIRSRQPGVRVLLITGLTMDERMNRIKEEIAPDAFLRKPITTSVFLEAVARLADEIKEQVVPPAEAQVLRELQEVLPGEPANHTAAPDAVEAGVSAAPAPNETLSEKLARLRARLGAVSVMLLEARGKVAAQAGDASDLVIDETFTLPFLASLSAGRKLGVSFTDGQSVQVVRGSKYELAVGQVGEYLLVAVLKGGGTVLRAAIAVEELLEAQVDLLTVLHAIGLVSQQPAGPSAEPADTLPADSVEPESDQAAPEGDHGLEKLEALIDLRQAGTLPVDDADAFWDAATDEVQKDKPGAGGLSFEEARKLGLVPPDRE